MTLTLAPNIEALVGKWLREHPNIVTLGATVSGGTPSTLMAPWVRVTLLAANDNATAKREYLIDHMLQLDCYAGKTASDAHTGQAEAFMVKQTARAILTSYTGQLRDGVVITDVRVIGDARVPDTAMEPARERYIMTIGIVCHAVSA